MSMTDVIEREGRRLLVLPEDSTLQGRVEIEIDGDKVIVSPAHLSEEQFRAARSAFWAEMDRLRDGEWFEYAGQIDTHAPYFG